MEFLHITHHPNLQKSFLILLVEDPLTLKIHLDLLKPKYNSGKWISEINKEEVAVLNSLSEDNCNSIYNTLSNDLDTFYSKNKISI